MKKLHRADLYCWSEFNEDRNIDFHSILWVRPEGNVLFDPLALSDHDQAHLESLGGAKIIIISNSDHCRDAENISTTTGATIYGPAEEQEHFPIECSHWLREGDKLVDGLSIYQVNGSKTAGELAFVIDSRTLITGDLVRCHEGGKLALLPDPKLKDKKQAILSVKKLADLNRIEVVLPGDGWPVFSGGQLALKELLQALS
jgi:glyoxylase-like metal-dependent hydrolase (beta-lactamase superfamily II)